METMLEQTLEINFISRKSYLEVRAAVTSAEELEKLIQILKISKGLLTEK